jgi:hypothetical protein
MIRENNDAWLIRMPQFNMRTFLRNNLPTILQKPLKRLRTFHRKGKLKFTFLLAFALQYFPSSEKQFLPKLL